MKVYVISRTVKIADEDDNSYAVFPRGCRNIEEARHYAEEDAVEQADYLGLCWKPPLSWTETSGCEEFSQVEEGQVLLEYTITQVDFD